jgi:DNA polymerase
MTTSLDPRQRAMLAEMGVRVWQKAPVDAAPSVVVDAAPPAAKPVAVKPTSVGVAPALRQPAPTPQTAIPTVALAPAATLGELPEGLSTMDWTSLTAAAANCRACGLCAHRQHSVFADGQPAVGQGSTDWLIVGDAPNDSENTSGKPFAGPESDLLDAMLQAMGLQRHGLGRAKESVVLVNALKCMPPAQRNPHPEELAQCSHFLKRQMELLQPRMVLAMGRLAALAVLQDTLVDSQSLPLGKLRGQVHQAHGRPVIVTYHPSYLMRTPADKAKAWHDLCLAMAQLRQTSPP